MNFKRPMCPTCRAKKKALISELLRQARFLQDNGMSRQAVNKKLQKLVNTPEKIRLVRGMRPGEGNDPLDDL